MQAKPGLKVMLNTPEEDDEEEHFVDEPEEGENKPVKKVLEYDGRKRDPRFSNAEKSCLWELVKLCVKVQDTFFTYRTN